METPEGMDPHDLPSDMPEGAGQEPEWQRLNREMLELLNELRIALPGATVLFSFLLILAFNDRFARLNGFDHLIYYLTFLAAGSSAILLMAPSAHHRLRWRRYDKDRLLRIANRLTLAGLALLTVAIGGAVFLVTEVLFSTAAALAVAVLGLCFVAFIWFVIPELGKKT